MLVAAMLTQCSGGADDHMKESITMMKRRRRRRNPMYPVSTLSIRLTTIRIKASIWDKEQD